MRSLLRIIIVGSVLAGLVPARGLAAQADAFVGTWKLNVAQSKYNPGPAPKSVTVTFAKVGAATKVTVTSVGSDGKAMGSAYTTMLDGKDATVTGSEDYDAVAVKQLDPMTRHSVRKKGGKEVQVSHTVMSKDGKHYTSTTTGTNAAGAKINNVAVFDKQ